MLVSKTNIVTNCINHSKARERVPTTSSTSSTSKKKKTKNKKKKQKQKQKINNNNKSAVTHFGAKQHTKLLKWHISSKFGKEHVHSLWMDPWNPLQTDGRLDGHTYAWKDRQAANIKWAIVFW